MDLLGILDRDAVLRDVLERNAAVAPGDVCVSFEGGGAWTHLQARDAAYVAANALRAQGVGDGGRVALLLPNDASFYRAWWGAACIGAAIVPINTAARGPILRRLLEHAAPTLLIVAKEYRSRLDDAGIALPSLLGPDELTGGDPTPPSLERTLQPWDLAALVLTSGTTGPSKLARITGWQLYFGAASYFGPERLGEDDVFLVDLPLFHLAALTFTIASLVPRTRIALRSRPALDSYWEVARDEGVTAVCLLSTMTTVLTTQDPRPAEREHSVRVALISPVPADIAGFKKRYGITSIFTQYGSTEAPSPLLGAADDAGESKGFCGRPNAGYDVRLVNDDDIDVPQGEVGQLIMRHQTPWTICSGYEANPEWTAAAWRNGWFHTGDMMRQDREGRFYFVDRLKDSLRRRGEMISAFEVEMAILEHPGIAEAACVAHPTESGVDDDVKAWLVLKRGATVDFEELFRHCVSLLPHFMVPRYFEMIAEFPKTPSLRVQKFELRALGNGNRAWDCERHGLRVTRRGIESIRRT
jgi:crotonobetaine/carnitine-CoA ligase